jgi:hypothetical protein
MKPIGKALLVVCLCSFVVGGVVLAAPEVSPAWTVGALALLTVALLATHGRRGTPPMELPLRERVIFEKRIRLSAGLEEEPDRSGGKPEILLRIVNARGTRLRNTLPGSHGKSSNGRRSRIS